MSTPGSYEFPPQDIAKLYFEQLDDTLQQIESAWRQIQDDDWRQDNADLIQQMAHKLAGSSLTLGYTQIGMASRAVEYSFRDATKQMTVSGETAEDTRTAPAIRRYAHVLTCLEHDLDTLRQAVVTRHQDEVEPLRETTVASQQSRQDSRSVQSIFLVEDDPVQARELTMQIGYFGYTVQAFTQLADLHTALAREKPAVILMDIIFPEGEMAGAETVLALRHAHEDPPPVIFVSSRTDLQARLHSVRAGGKAYFSKPVNIGKLIDVLDHLLKENKPIPYRVLVVDDIAIQAQMTSRHLTAAGMETAIVTDPLKIIETLDEFNPELLLLDVYMPGCTGLELAEVIRQMDTFISIPIVFFSAETDRDKQLQAMGLGGDDFLTKPLRPDYLVSAVTSRIERYRQLRALMVRDSLTGALNHSTIKELLNQELSRAGRQNTALSFVMIDLDHFKSVNDTYGHAAGDRVLRSLAHLLKKRLRHHDIVGRYGGEEFSVVLPATTGTMSLKIMDELRADFAMVLHQSNDADFSVTFSCGIADFPRFETLGKIGEAADKALYQAKREGRNRVILAEASQALRPENGN
jgi:diguanylate cyclase (GGDEF)-like protein